MYTLNIRVPMYTKKKVIELNSRKILIVNEKYIDKNVVRIFKIKSDPINKSF